MKKELGIFVLLLQLCATVAVLNPQFLSAFNLQNTTSLIGMYGIFSIGLGLIIITGGIDLSVGSVFALLGVLLFFMLREWDWPWILSALAAVGVSMFLGLFHGCLITQARMQPFIVTLCGLLFYRGLARFITQDTTKGFGAEDFGILRDLASGYLPVPMFAAVLIGAWMLFLLWRQAASPKNILIAAGALLAVQAMVAALACFVNYREAYSFGGAARGWMGYFPLGYLGGAAVFIALMAAVAMIWCAVHRRFSGRAWTLPLLFLAAVAFTWGGVWHVFGTASPVRSMQVPAPFVLLILVGAVMWVVLHRSVYGRYLYAVGRNEAAARYSGIRSRLVITSAYVISGVLVGLSGILFAFYTNSIAPSTHGTFFELFGIAAAVLGGCSLSGGEGSIVGIIIGAALLQVLQNLVNLLGIPSSLNFSVMGAVILVGVLADQLLRRRRYQDN